MNASDRIALELGRALIRAIVAEEQVALLQQKVKEQEDKEEDDAD